MATRPSAPLSRNGRGVKLSADGMKLLDEGEARVQKLSILMQSERNGMIDGLDAGEEEDY